MVLFFIPESGDITRSWGQNGFVFNSRSGGIARNWGGRMAWIKEWDKSNLGVCLVVIACWDNRDWNRKQHE